MHCRRKFRSQTSDNMDRWKAEVEQKNKEEKSRREKIREEKESKKEDAGARKAGKVAKHCVIPMVCGSRGSKSRLAKAAGAEPAAGQMRDEQLHAVVARSTFPSQNVQSTSAPDFGSWDVESAHRCGAKHISKSKCTKHLSIGPLLEVAMSKKCTPLWREAHLHVKKLKAPQRRSTFGSWDVEKVHTVVAGSTFPSQNVQKHLSFGLLFEVAMSKKCTPLWREAHFEVKMLKTFRNTTCSRHFWTFRCCFAWQAQGIVDLVKSEQNVRVCRISKNDGRRGTFEEDLHRCIFRGRRSTGDVFIRAVRRSERWFPERGCILELQIFRFAEMILHDRCSTSYDLASLCRGRRSSLDKWTETIAKRIGTRPSALHSTFHFWRTSRRIASFLMFST